MWLSHYTELYVQHAFNALAIGTLFQTLAAGQHGTRMDERLIAVKLLTPSILPWQVACSASTIAAGRTAAVCTQSSRGGCREAAAWPQMSGIAAVQRTAEPWRPAMQAAGKAGRQAR